MRCSNTVDDGVAIYAGLVQSYLDPPNNFVRSPRPYPAGIGSAKFQKVSYPAIEVLLIFVLN